MTSMTVTEGIKEIKKQLTANGYSKDDIKYMVSTYIRDIEEGYDVDYIDYILPRVYDFVIENI